MKEGVLRHHNRLRHPDREAGQDQRRHRPARARGRPANRREAARSGGRVGGTERLKYEG